MKKIFSIIIVCLCTISYCICYSACVNANLSDNLLRFHIIANSDSDYDQNVKFAVRDYVSKNLAQDGDLVSDSQRLANEYLSNSGIGYTAKATEEYVFIPKKRYNNIALPSGNYRAIRLILGEGTGKNWWCVAYPKLCFCEATNGKISQDGMDKLKKSLNNEGFCIIADDKCLRFKIVDITNSILEKIN